MTQYAVLIVGDADRWWTTMTDEERARGYAEYDRYAAELARRGHAVLGGAELSPTTQARSLLSADGPVTDGPFAETAEHIGGFFHVETDDVDDLLECCRILAALGDGVEVRPVVTAADRAGGVR